MIAGSAFSATKVVFWSMPAPPVPTSSPAIAASPPEIAQEMPNMRPTGIALRERGLLIEGRRRASPVPRERA